jgi:hypothetical protein
MPWPSVTIIVRSIPGKREKGPELATTARLMRQSKVSMVEDAGNLTTSLVMPPPFFHGVDGKDSAEMSFQTMCAGA